MLGGTQKTQGNYKTDVLATLADLQAFIAEWRTALKSLVDIHFYQDLEQILISYQHNQKHQHFCIIVVRLDGQIQCIAPLIREPEKLTLKLGLIKLAKVKCPRFKLKSG